MDAPGVGNESAMIDDHVTWKPTAVDLVVEAMGMVSVQADCALGDALLMMADRADVRDCSVDEIAAAVVAGSTSFAA